MSDSPSADILTNPSAFEPTHPFDSAAGADAILRSSDGVDFYIHRAILSLVSRVFETMFTLPQSESSPAVPVIDLSETSVALDRTLRLFYPGTDQSVGTLEELRQVIDFVVKYDMQRQIPVAKQLLRKYYSTQPLAVYAIALKHQWNDVAKAVARESLVGQRLDVLNSDAPPEVDELTARAYHNWLQYHTLCGKTAKAAATKPTWFDPGSQFSRCKCVGEKLTCYGGQSQGVPSWFFRYVFDTGAMLAITPGLDIRQLDTFSAAWRQEKCFQCRPFDFVNFATVLLPQQIEAELDKVELKF
ncbi:hypothetical protein FB45DRAFT_788445 [Roridomyces roridus]|uniref:BTB domain-containing protein n=1 Tax=Roridomyces roridus TaxID=1738132 RepID=A0AAD7C0I5_9AGAR|nr:hypothetical protein FB45DRAFT_788445 [Roridomyces roridus]